MKEYALIIDYKYCTGCHSCEVACKQEKDLGPGEWGIHLEDMGPIFLNDSWHWDYHAIPTTICDLCIDRIKEGLEPACVHHCLANCMEAVKIDDIPNALKALGDGSSVYVPV